MPYGSFTNHFWSTQQAVQELLPRPHRWPLGHHYGPIRFSLEGWRIQAQQLPPPPRPLRAFFCDRGEPVLPEHRTDLSRRVLRKRIGGKKGQHILVIGKQSHLRVRHDRIVTPGTQGCEPQVPIEARLIRRVDPRRLVQILRLVAKRVSHPVPSILRTLEFDLVPSARHHREEAVLIGNPERLKCGYRGRG